jgi:hypothetical protein
VIAPRAVPIPGPPGQLDALDALLKNPGDHYVLLNDVAHPNGFLRGQLRFAETITLQLDLQTRECSSPGIRAGRRWCSQHLAFGAWQK